MPMQYIRCVFKSRGVSQCGCCSFSHVLPLLEVRSRARIPEGARTVIFALFPYYTGLLPHRNLSRYAVPDDYHLIAGRVLEGCQGALEEAFPQERFVSFVDSSPIREVQGAYLAGLGWMGRNGQLINPRFGSYVFIGEIVTTLEIPCQPRPMGKCLDCGACRRACPTGALTEGSVEEALCRSAVTQKKGELTLWETEQIRAGGMVWGCDICNDVCPMNRRALPSDMRQFYQSMDSVVTEENLSRLRKRKAFGYRGRAVMERNLGILAASKTEREVYDG